MKYEKEKIIVKDNVRYKICKIYKSKLYTIFAERFCFFKNRMIWDKLGTVHSVKEAIDFIREY
jgi:hypothetical protein